LTSTHIIDLKDGQKKVDISGEITAMPESRTVHLRVGGIALVCDATFRDGSDAIKLSLWDDQIKQCKVGARIRIENGYVTTYRGEKSLNIGKFGSLHFL